MNPIFYLVMTIIINNMLQTDLSPSYFMYFNYIHYNFTTSYPDNSYQDSCDNKKKCLHPLLCLFLFSNAVHNKAMKEQNDQLTAEDWLEIDSWTNKEELCFGSVDDKQIVEFESTTKNPNTKRATKMARVAWTAYSSEKKLEVPITMLPFLQRNKMVPILHSFIFEVRKQDGSEYKKTSLRVVVLGLFRHIHDSRSDNMWILKVEGFKRVVAALVVKKNLLVQKGKGKTKHHSTIPTEHEEKLLGAPTYDRTTPEGLNQSFHYLLLKQWAL